ncbi:hypothetical protein [Cetobacterium sp.]|uniref:hypothetical protein n=1 Tax=Cetobacterium sp. TaxID=2071632 RepID=UPI003F66D886
MKKSEETVEEETLYSLLDKIIKKIELGNYKKVIFDVLGGEITEDIELYAKGIVYAMNKLGDRFIYSLCVGSNGLDFESLYRFLEFFNNDKISGIGVSISLDLDEGSHNKYRKVYKNSDVNSYVIVKNNIKKLMRLYGKNPKFDIKISSVCHCEDGLNRENILELLELSNLNIRVLIQNDYTKFDEKIINKLYKIISEIYIDILNEKINPTYMLSSNELGFVNMLKLPNENINFCPQKSLFFINNDSNVYSCSTLTYNLDERTETLFKLDDNMNSKYSSVMSTACLNTCSHCELKVFCRKSCYYYNDHECIPWRKKQAECIRDVYRKILKCDKNGEKLFKYYKKISNNHSVNNYDVLEENREKIIKTIKRLVR